MKGGLVTLIIICLCRLSDSVKTFKVDLYPDLIFENTETHYIIQSARSLLECNVFCGKEERCSKGYYDKSAGKCTLYETDPQKLPNTPINHWISFISKKADWGFTRHGFRLAAHTEFFGRAEIKIGNTWGSICDDSVEEGGWPTAFCRILGYSYSSEIKLAKNYYTIDDRPVHVHNLSCVGSIVDLIKFFEQCSSSNAVKCSHSNDVFIRCVK